MGILLEQFALDSMQLLTNRASGVLVFMLPLILQSLILAEAIYGSTKTLLATTFVLVLLKVSQ